LTMLGPWSPICRYLRPGLAASLVPCSGHSDLTMEASVCQFGSQETEEVRSIPPLAIAQIRERAALHQITDALHEGGKTVDEGDGRASDPLAGAVGIVCTV
jgi:hypothetical protein